MVDRCIARWDNGKNVKVGKLRNEALEEIGSSKLKSDATFSDDDFSDDDSFFDSENEDKFECMDDDVFLLNFCDRQSNSNLCVDSQKRIDIWEDLLEKIDTS